MTERILFEANRGFPVLVTDRKAVIDGTTFPCDQISSVRAELVLSGIEAGLDHLSYLDPVSRELLQLSASSNGSVRLFPRRTQTGLSGADLQQYLMFVVCLEVLGTSVAKICSPKQLEERLSSFNGLVLDRQAAAMEKAKNNRRLVVACCTILVFFFGMMNWMELDAAGGGVVALLSVLSYAAFRWLEGTPIDSYLNRYKRPALTSVPAKWRLVIGAAGGEKEGGISADFGYLDSIMSAIVDATTGSGRERRSPVV